MIMTMIKLLYPRC